MRNQLDNLEEADMDFSQFVSTTVYLDNLQTAKRSTEFIVNILKNRCQRKRSVQQLPPTTLAPLMQKPLPGPGTDVTHSREAHLPELALRFLAPEFTQISLGFI